MAPLNVPSPAFVLHFPDAVRVAGETIQGRVELNVALAQEEGIESLCINLSGSIVTYATSSPLADLYSQIPLELSLNLILTAQILKMRELSKCVFPIFF